MAGAPVARAKEAKAAVVITFIWRFEDYKDPVWIYTNFVTFGE
jgi:hypothetical protein